LDISKINIIAAASLLILLSGKLPQRILRTNPMICSAGENAKYLNIKQTLSADTTAL
jgi:hypothetical protein